MIFVDFFEKSFIIIIEIKESLDYILYTIMLNNNKGNVK